MKKLIAITLCIFICGCMGLNVGGGTAYNLVTGETDPVAPDSPFPTTPEVIGLPPKYGGFITIPLGFLIEYGTFPAMLPLGLIGGSVWGAFSIPEARLKQKARNPETPANELYELAKNPNPEIRKALATNPKAPLELVKSLALDGEPKVRAYASYALGGRYNEADAIVPILVKNLNDKNPDVQYGAAKAIASMRVYAKAAVPDLTRHLFHPKAPIRATCAEALGNIGYSARGSLPKLQKLLADDNDSVRSQAKNAIDKISGRDADENINPLEHP